ncbi:MAG: hypothetical protein GJU67_04285 [Ferrovum sp.]|nr:hypothetical protein [Ferrovum sp.]
MNKFLGSRLLFLMMLGVSTTLYATGPASAPPLTELEAVSLVSNAKSGDAVAVQKLLDSARNNDPKAQT